MRVPLSRAAMSRSKLSSRYLTIMFTLFAGVLPQLSTPAPAHTIGAIVPAYFYPGTGGPDAAGDGWAAMVAAAAQVPLTAIFNPDKGPLPGPADPNYANAMTNLDNAGGKVVGYVYTDYGNRPLATVEGEVSTYIAQYGSLIDGFFLDGASNSPSEIWYYDALYLYIKGLGPSNLVIINPGLQPDQAYLSTPTADIFTTYENQNSSYAGATPPSWVQDYPSGVFSNIIYDAPESSVLANIELAAQRNVGSIYMTDRTMPNPFDQLPSYWNQEVAAIAAWNAAPVPEPGTLSLLGIAGSLAFVAFVAKKRMLV